MRAFDELQSVPPRLLADGYLARAVRGQHLTLAVVEVAPDAVLPEHQHPNEQFGMVIDGSGTPCAPAEPVADETTTGRRRPRWSRRRFSVS